MPVVGSLPVRCQLSSDFTFSKPQHVQSCHILTFQNSDSIGIIFDVFTVLVVDNNGAWMRIFVHFSHCCHRHIKSVSRLWFAQ